MQGIRVVVSDQSRVEVSETRTVAMKGQQTTMRSQSRTPSDRRELIESPTGSHGRD
jgi:hypothetical protein